MDPGKPGGMMETGRMKGICRPPENAPADSFFCPEGREGGIVNFALKKEEPLLQCHLDNDIGQKDTGD